MRTDVRDIEAFYAGPLGQMALDFLCHRLGEAWQRGAGTRIAGFGYTSVFLEAFDEAERRINLMPEGMGVIATLAGNSCLVADNFWPLPDASMDRILVVHGLEETAEPRRLLREMWRVLSDDGRVIIVVPNRRGPWAMVDTTPFSAGRPYLRGQLDRLLRDAMFTPSYWSSALFFPPLERRFLLRAAPAWERAGQMLWSPLAGVTLVEAVKEIAIPAGGSRAEVLKPRLLNPAGAALSRRQ